jgi:hypothetical protein
MRSRSDEMKRLRSCDSTVGYSIANVDEGLDAQRHQPDSRSDSAA